MVELKIDVFLELRTEVPMKVLSDTECQTFFTFPRAGVRKDEHQSGRGDKQHADTVEVELAHAACRDVQRRH